MFGNVQGWLISLVMLMAAGGAVYKMAMPPSESKPAGLIPLAYQAVKLPIEASIVAPPGTSDCDAGDLYRQAIEEYEKDPSKYQNVANKDVSQLPGVQLILQAADCSRMGLFENNPKQIINYQNPKPWIEALMALGQATVNTGFNLNDSKPREAKKYYEAAFALGEKMFDERVAWPELNNGLSIMSMGTEQLTVLADHAKEGVRVDVLRKLKGDIDDYRNKLQDKVDSPLGNSAESYAAPFSGDVFAIAKDTKVDRIWRVEAILHIGHYRWGVGPGRAGDQTAAVPELQKLESSPDPKNDTIIKTAARAAQDLTVEQHRG
jgi:hypothetical protein